MLPCCSYEDEMQTDVQSEEPSFRPHTHEETLTVEPREGDVEVTVFLTYTSVSHIGMAGRSS